MKKLHKAIQKKNGMPNWQLILCYPFILMLVVVAVGVVLFPPPVTREETIKYASEEDIEKTWEEICNIEGKLIFEDECLTVEEFDKRMGKIEDNLDIPESE